MHMRLRRGCIAYVYMAAACRVRAPAYYPQLPAPITSVAELGLMLEQSAPLKNRMDVPW